MVNQGEELMPTYEITSPDGQTYEVTAPEGASQDEILAYVKSNAAPKEFSEPQWLQDMRASGVDNPTTGMSGFDKFAAGYGSAVPNLAMGVGQRLGLVSQDEATQQKSLMGPLMDTGAGFAGSVAGSVAAAAPASVIPGANTMAGSAALGGLLGASQLTNADESALGNAAFGVAGGALGQKLGQSVGGLLARRAASKTAAGVANTVRDATLKAGQEAGYVVAPAATNPTAWNRLIQGLAGKTATGQRAAMMNQATTNKLAREAVGLAEDAPITTEALNAVRTEAGRAYDVLKQFDEIPLDQQYMDDVLKAAKPYLDTASEFPELASKEVQDAIQLANRQKVSGNGLIEVTKTLREKADAAFRGGDKSLGRILKGISTAMEDAGERHLATTGDEAALGAFQAARQTIAKTYTLEKALNPGTGNIVASKLGAELQRGKPLSGGLKTAAKFSKAFPRETQEVANSSWLQMPGISPLDWTVAAGATASQGPAGLLTLAARPAAQAMLTSKPYQKLMATPKYSPGLMAKGIEKLLKTKSGQGLMQALGAMGGVGLRPDAGR